MWLLTASRHYTFRSSDVRRQQRQHLCNVFISSKANRSWKAPINFVFNSQEDYLGLICLPISPLFLPLHKLPVAGHCSHYLFLQYRCSTHSLTPSHRQASDHLLCRYNSVLKWHQQVIMTGNKTATVNTNQVSGKNNKRQVVYCKIHTIYWCCHFYHLPLWITAFCFVFAKLCSIATKRRT